MGPTAFSDPIIFTFIQVLLNILLSSVLWLTELVDSRTIGVYGEYPSNVPQYQVIIFFYLPETRVSDDLRFNWKKSML